MIKKIFYTISALVVVSCQSNLHFCKEPPCLPPLVKVVKSPRVALVLGGGGVRGLAHVGVLEVLEQNRIPIDLIVGCSAGSIVGALYADHPCAKDIEKALIHLKRSDLLKIQLFNARYGISHGGGIRALMERHLANKDFCDLKIPLRIVATDLKSGELLVLGGGEVIPAVHASSSVPFIFKPVPYYGRILVDGGVVDPIPVKAALQENPLVIIAVDVSMTLDDESPTNLFGIAARSAEISHLKLAQTCVEGADIVIRPKVGHLGIFEEGSSGEIYEAGKLECEKAMPEIIELLKARGIF